MLNKIKTIARHVWQDRADADSAIPPDMLARLTQRIAASETRHSGEIRMVAEAALPMSYLWRLGKTSPMKMLVRQRAVTLFGKLRVWDTEQNNGVLIYLQLVEHAIEIVADRGLTQHVSSDQWQAMVARMSAHFAAKRFEDGLTQALEEVSSELVRIFPAVAGQTNADEMPNEPLLR